jgi:ribosomal protein S18 acetylase RimI-like enzyme
MSPLPADLAAREMTAADIPAVVATVRRCDATYAEWADGWQQPSVAEETEDWEELLAMADGSAIVAADAEGTVAGAVGWKQAEDETVGRVPGVAHVVSVFTDPSRWREGIARALLSLAEEEMRLREFRIARLWTPRDAPARAFYDREGWTLDGRERFAEKLGFHLVGYEKRLTG